MNFLDIEYHKDVFDGHHFVNLLRSVPWKSDVVKVFGQTYTTKRKTAWYGDKEYTYSNTTKKPIPWNDTLLEIKMVVESVTGQKFNSCLLNLYEDGSAGLGWHSDDEKGMGNVIASVSLGAVRTFKFKDKYTHEVIKIPLEDRSLLVMKGETQKHWLHCVPKSKNVDGPRINLTFRSVV